MGSTSVSSSSSGSFSSSSSSNSSSSRDDRYITSTRDGSGGIYICSSVCSDIARYINNQYNITH